MRKNLSTTILLLIGALFFSCADSTEKSEELLNLFIKKHEQQLADTERNLRLAHWAVLLEHNPMNAKKVVQHARDYITNDSQEDTLKTREFYNIQLDKMYSNQDDLEFLEKLLTCNHIHDPLLQLQLKVLISKYRQQQINPELYEQSTNYFIKIARKFSKQYVRDDSSTFTFRNNLEVLARSLDPQQLKQAWKENEQIAEIVFSESINKVIIANKIADQYSKGEFENYHQYICHSYGTEKGYLDSLRIVLEQESRLPYLHAKKKLDSLICSTMHIRCNEIRPWHYGKFIQGRTPSILVQPLEKLLDAKNIEKPVSSFFYTIDLPMDDVIAKSNLITRNNMDPRSFFMVIDSRENDIRVNAHLGHGLYSLSAFLYVLGGAASNRFIQQDIPFLLHDQHQIITHTSSNYFSRYAFSPAWLENYLGIELTGQNHDNLQQMYQTVRLFRLRRHLLLSHFLEALYTDPTRNLNDLWSSLVYKYLYISYPEGRNIPWWASIINVARGDIRNESMLFAFIAEAQIDYYLGKNADDVRIGLFFKDLFQDALLLSWQETFKKAFGEPLNANYLLRDIG